MKITSQVRCVACCIFAILLSSTCLWAEPIPLKQVVQLALAHASGIAISAAEEQQEEAVFLALHRGYIPQLTTGAGLGWSYGFPLGLEGSAPALFNVNAQSPVFNPALRESIRAAKLDAAVASLKNKDERNAVIQDAVSSYAELSKWEQRLIRLQQSAEQAEKLQAAVADRLKEGVDTEMDATRAHLSAARIHLRIAEAQGSAAVVREHLSKLTGLPANAIETESNALPEFPAVPQDPDLPAKAADASPGVQAAVEHARAQYLRAKGEHRAFWPSFDFAAQYALLSTFNNFQYYYIPAKPCTVAGVSVLCQDNVFKRNNATVGVSIRFPFFSPAQRARAASADADALKATKQAEATRNQASEETMRLEHSVVQMQAAVEVAELEYEIAMKNVDAVKTRMDAGTANLHDLDDARSQASEHFITLQDVTLELQRTELALLRATGGLEKWALGTP
ncbi:MAG TPA: TolC family protein [Verrucomicrobiae bacterium]|jgi:outer membrane protein TolC|nr:TolC family protein [Verrucomicrobiae bacterium]